MTKIIRMNKAFYFCFAAMLLQYNHTLLAADLSCPNPSGSTNGGSSGQFGPYDYRDPSARTGPSNPLHLVEMAHFTAEIATGSTYNLAGGLNYTLRVFPNHHRALQSLADLGIRERKSNVDGLPYTIPCLFFRAKNYAPTDGMVNAVFAYYLANMNQKDMALTEVEQAIKKAGNNPRIYYDIGLAYYYIGDYNKAMESSEIAKKLGSSAVGLDTLLSQVIHKKNVKR